MRRRSWASSSFTTTFDELADADLVIEAVIESPEVKFEVFRTLDSVVKPEGILASNTSSIPIVEIGSRHRAGPNRCSGMHFFNPATVQPLVELIYSQKTSEETMTHGPHLLPSTPSRRARSAPAIVPASSSTGCWCPTCCRRWRCSTVVRPPRRTSTPACAAAVPTHMGPLELSDLIGLDTMLLVAEVLYDEFKEKLYAPPAVLKRMVAAGELGRKTGKGFYDYS